MITSAHNQLIKSVRKLSCKKERLNQQLFFAEGLRVCSSLIEGEFVLVHLLLTPTNADVFNHYSSNVLSKITLIDEGILKKISSLSTPNGIVGVFRIKEQTTTSLGEGLILYHLQDPGNVGTLIRSCAAMNRKNIVLINSVDPYHPKVIQAAAGSFASINFVQCSWQELLKRRTKEGFSIGALVVRGGKDPTNVSFKNMMLMVGNEARGIDQSAVEQCDETISLCMPGSTESLNAGVAGSIALYLSVNKY